MIDVYENNWQCYPIIAGKSLNYKAQVVIIGIKSGMKYSIFYVPSEKRKNFCKIGLKQTYGNVYGQLIRQNIVE